MRNRISDDYPPIPLSKLIPEYKTDYWEKLRQELIESYYRQKNA